MMILRDDDDDNDFDGDGDDVLNFAIGGPEVLPRNFFVSLTKIRLTRSKLPI